jgi:hypothetical protein
MKPEDTAGGTTITIGTGRIMTVTEGMSSFLIAIITIITTGTIMIMTVISDMQACKIQKKSCLDLPDSSFNIFPTKEGLRLKSCGTENILSPS